MKEAIILAGGLGTRLRSVIADLPKCMAPVAGKPFLHYVIAHLQKQGIEKFIFSVGYLYEPIENFLQQNYPALQYDLSIEEEPLGTGGAIRLACTKTSSPDVIVVNGDTLFIINLDELLKFHTANNADCSLCLKPMKNFDRYGTVELNNDLSIASFREKQFITEGLINGGVYAIHVEHFLKLPLPNKFSFEKEYLEKFVQQDKMYGLILDTYFIDIGIPEDYNKAQIEFADPLSFIDKSWTLFLDRDGVINYEKHLDYIHTWDEFVFYDGVKQALKIFGEVFNRIIVVTNQKGIGKGMTKTEDLQTIHQNMVAAIEKEGGRIDAVYFCPDLEETSPNRKPNPGMGLQAKKDFPEIDLTKCIMVGNTLSDMEFGRNLGAMTIFLPTTRPEVNTKDTRIDLVYPSLIALALDL